MATYYPPTNIDIPWNVIVLRFDPDFEREKRDQLLYEFSNGRQFRGDPSKLGPYSGD